jgi:HEAT repeat protein
VRIGQPAVPALIEALSHKDVATRKVAARTLGELGPLAQDSFAPLAKALNDPEEWIRWNVVRAIGRVGAEPKSVVPLLERIFRSGKEEKFIRAAALEGLHNADPNGTLVIPTLVEALKDADGEIVAAAAQALGKFGSKARPAVVDLKDALSTNKQRWTAYYDFGFTVPVRIDVIRALAEIGPDAELAVPSLTGIMNDDTDSTAQIWAAAALVRISPKKPVAEEGLALIIRNLHDEKSNCQTQAAEALGTIGSDAAITALVEVLQAQDSSKWGTLRESAAEALGAIGPSAKAAVPALRTALLEQRWEHFGLRREAALALGRIGAASKVVIPDLVSLSNSDDETLRDLAAEAIEKINDQLTGRETSR